MDGARELDMLVEAAESDPFTDNLHEWADFAIELAVEAARVLEDAKGRVSIKTAHASRIIERCKKAGLIRDHEHLLEMAAERDAAWG